MILSTLLFTPAFASDITVKNWYPEWYEWDIPQQSFTITQEQWNSWIIPLDQLCTESEWGPWCIIKSNASNNISINPDVLKKKSEDPNTTAAAKDIVKPVVENSNKAKTQDNKNNKRIVTAELAEWDCSYDGTGNIEEALAKCVTWSGTNLFNGKDWKWLDNLNVSGDGFKWVLTGWIAKIAGFLSLWAIFAIAYGSLRMTLSGWSEEHIKKARDIVKWWILGFLAVISAWFLITLVVNIMYSFG